MEKDAVSYIARWVRSVCSHLHLYIILIYREADEYYESSCGAAKSAGVICEVGGSKYHRCFRYNFHHP